tara:strand:- start:9990 stop:11453 length:1464 start_codon:yes stop_codon:yes gene_type:complete
VNDEQPVYSALPEKEAIAQIRHLLDRIKTSAHPDQVWDLRFHIDILAESLRESQARVLGLQEENRQLHDRVLREKSDYESLRASMDELLNLHELTEAISTTFAISDIISALMDLSARFLPSQSCGVFSLGGGDMKLDVLYTRGDQRIVQCVQAQCDDGIVDWVLRGQRPVVVEDMSTVEHSGMETCSVVLVPLRVRARNIGLYGLYCRRPKDAFTAGEMELLSVLANQTAIALENARLYSELTYSSSQLKESQQQLLMAEKMAAIGRLAGGVAHEVNNPLQIMLSRVQLLRMNAASGDRLEEGLESIERGVKRISKIIRGLLDIAGHNAAERVWGPCDLVAALDRTLELVQHELERAEVKIVFTCDDCLPLVAGNIGELEQVFLNLIINAQHAMPEGGTLAVSARVVDEAVLMEFADTGIGIPDALLDNIFEPFFSTRSEQGGTGLGLSVSYGIVERHGGSIEVHSEYGEGTRFSLRFPVAEGAFDA